MALEDVRRFILLSIDPLAKANWSTTSTLSHKVLQEIFADGQSNPQWKLKAIEPQAIDAGFP